MAANNNYLCKICSARDEKCMAIFCEKGIKLEVDTILSKHFGIHMNLSKDDIICCDCWQIVSKFHQLYLKVEKNIKKDLVVELNPNECIIVKNELYENEEVEHKYNKETCNEVHELEEVLLDNHHHDVDAENAEDSVDDKDDDDDDDDDYGASDADEADEDSAMDNEVEEKPKGIQKN